jgi:hypothetical protein
MEVYGLFGHGCDIITDREDTTDRPMPAGCIYVTVVLCGVTSFYLNKLMYAFQDPYIQDALKHPIENLEKINKYFTLHHQNVGMAPIIHVHAAGTAANTYVDSINDLCYDSGDVLDKSGLYKLGDLKPLDTADLVGRGVVDFVTSLRYIRRGAVDPASLEEIYRGSMIQPAHFTNPAGDPFTSFTDFKMTNAASLARRLSGLFAERPGIYYNFACRSSCIPALQSRTEARRERSRSKQFRAEHYARLGYDIPPLPSAAAVAAVDHRVAQHADAWFNERARVTIEYIDSERRKKALRSMQRLSRRASASRLRSARSNRNRVQRLAKPVGAYTSAARARSAVRSIVRSGRSATRRAGNRNAPKAKKGVTRRSS